MINLEHYQRHQKWYELTLIGVFFLINNTILATSILMENFRKGSELPFHIWEPFVWEYSSAISTIALVPGIVWLLRTWPIGWLNLKSTLPIYFVASLVFSLLHVSGMVVLRVLIYATQGLDYQFGNIPFELIYEYRKDLWSFIFIIIVIQTYRYIVTRLQGEANLVNDGEDVQESPSDRILVKKLGKEFIVKIANIEWLESSGNYVNLHVDSRVYPVRATLTNFVDKIADKGFCRIHRSYGVNLDAIDTITPLGSGDSEIKLNSGKILNLSRRYKEQLKDRLQ